MKAKKSISALVLAAALCGSAAAAETSEKTDTAVIAPVRWEVGFTGAGATGDWAPYLLGSNSGGRHAMKGTAQVSGLVSKDFNLSQRFSWTAGAELAAGYQSAADYDFYDLAREQWTVRTWHPSRATVYQLWGGIKFRGVMLWAGMRDHVSPLVDDALSAGDMVLSNNARAIPVVEAGFVDFQDIPFTKGWAQIDGAISYGKFTDSNSVKERYNYWNDHIALGQLFTYKRIHFRSRPDVRFTVTIGMQVGGEFGGTTYRYNQGTLARVDKNDENLRAFWEMFFPKSRYRDGFMEGNHVGSWDFKARYRFDSGVNLEGYFQWFWEDGSGMAKRNMSDGLWGVALSFEGEKRPLAKIIAEYIDMRDQSGPIHWAPTDNPGTSIGTEATGGDNYYNSSSFNAWANYGLALGSSFPKAPLYNSDGFPQFEHNRTRGFQIAGTGFVASEVEWKAKFSYGVAWGMGRIPFARALKNTSMLVTAQWDARRILPGLRAGLSVAFDAGSLRGNNFGALVRVSYGGNFSLERH